MDDAKAAMTSYMASTGLDKKLNAPVLLQRLAAHPVASPVSTEGLELQLPLREGVGNEIKSVQGVSYKLTGKPEWTANSLLGAAPNFDSTDYAELGNVGDFDTTDAFSYGVWVRVANYTSSGALFARMDRNNNERGWDLYLDHGRPTVRSHQLLAPKRHQANGGQDPHGRDVAARFRHLRRQFQGGGLEDLRGR